MRASFYRRWIVACAAGELTGIGTATMAAVALNSWFGEPHSVPARLALLAAFAAVGAVEGGALAYLQWRVLRSRLPRLRATEWIGATVAVAVAGWIAGMAPSLFIASSSAPSGEPGLAFILALAAAAGGAAGLCFGAAQWFVLRRYALHAGRWIWIHLPAWALAMAAIFLGATVPDADWTPWAIGIAGVIGGILGGVLLGVVTGLVARELSPREGAAERHVASHAA
jgi:hypothetical protein